MLTQRYVSCVLCNKSMMKEVLILTLGSWESKTEVYCLLQALNDEKNSSGQRSGGSALQREVAVRVRARDWP